MAPFGALLLSNPFASRHHRCLSVLFSLLFVTESRNQDVIWWENSLFFLSLFLLVLPCCNSISLYLSSSVSRFNFQPNTKSILVCWSLKSKKTYCSCRQIRLRSSMILKGISAFPIGRLGARMKDYEKRKILLRVIHESLCLSVPIKQIFWLLIIRKMLRKTYILTQRLLCLEVLYYEYMKKNWI